MKHIKRVSVAQAQDIDVANLEAILDLILEFLLDITAIKEDGSPE